MNLASPAVVPTRIEVLRRTGPQVSGFDATIDPKAYASRGHLGSQVRETRIDIPNAVGREWYEVYDDVEWREGPGQSLNGLNDLAEAQERAWLKVLHGIKPGRHHASEQAAGKLFAAYDTERGSELPQGGDPDSMAHGLMASLDKFPDDWQTATRISFSNGEQRMYLGTEWDSKIPELVRTAAHGAFMTSEGWGFVEFQGG